MTDWQGFLNFHKPPKLTSHDGVARVRKLLRLRRVGHGGTLDPAATGVLPMALGKATRLLQYLPATKAYCATVRFGLQTTTDDLEGEPIAQAPVPWLTLSHIEPHLERFQGVIQQVPPQYSAIQVNGKRLYDLARSGQRVDVPVRTVEVFQINVLHWRSGQFPELDLAITCGSGTYIRSIARDLGTALHTGGTLAALTRTLSSGFTLDHSLTLETLTQQLELNQFHPIAPDAPLTHLPGVTLSEPIARRWVQGQRLALDLLEAEAIHPNLNPAINPEEASFYRVYAPGQRFLGIGQAVASPESGLLLPKVVWSSQDPPQPV